MKYFEREIVYRLRSQARFVDRTVFTHSEEPYFVYPFDERFSVSGFTKIWVFTVVKALCLSLFVLKLTKLY